MMSNCNKVMGIGYGPMLEHMRKKCEKKGYFAENMHRFSQFTSEPKICEKKGYFQQNMHRFSQFTSTPKICDCENNNGACNNTCVKDKKVLKFKLGEKVRKTSVGYQFSGVVTGIFEKLTGVVRYAVENQDGITHIFNEKSLESTGYLASKYVNFMNTNHPKREPKLNMGVYVEKTKGDYKYKGTIVCIFYELTGALRYCVEDDRGLLFIFNEKSLELVKNEATWDCRTHSEATV